MLNDNRSSAKSLINILEEERDLIQQINVLNDLIKKQSDRRVELLMCFTCEGDYEDERSYLAYLQNDIDRLNAEKFELQEKLVGIRRELAGYIKYNILKGE